mmetsp:Transcript_96815/g.166936  ORF Transcript_96815/g.166936 Transcript_96815/m.166936 type:complete len:203 (+) Transcript_96815:74-682(+)
MVNGCNGGTKGEMTCGYDCALSTLSCIKTYSTTCMGTAVNMFFQVNIPALSGTPKISRHNNTALYCPLVRGGEVSLGVNAAHIDVTTSVNVIVPGCCIYQTIACKTCNSSKSPNVVSDTHASSLSRYPPNARCSSSSASNALTRCSAHSPSPCFIKKPRNSLKAHCMGGLSLHAELAGSTGPSTKSTTSFSTSATTTSSSGC